MRYLLRFFGFLILFSACKKSDNSNDSVDKTENKSTVIEQNIIPAQILERAKATIKGISKKEFEHAEDLEINFQKVRQICEESKGYNNDIWEGVNECSWAVERERIRLHQEYVSRKEDQLILIMENQSLGLEHNPSAPAGSTFYQFKTYLPSTKYFVIEEMISGKCIRSKLINAANSNQYNVKGALLSSKNGNHFIAYYPKIGPSPICMQKLESYTLTSEGINKNWYIPLHNKIIKGIKYTEKGKLIFGIRPNNKKEEAPEYFQLTWL